MNSKGPLSRGSKPRAEGPVFLGGYVTTPMKLSVLLSIRESNPVFPRMERSTVSLCCRPWHGWRPATAAKLFPQCFCEELRAVGLRYRVAEMASASSLARREPINTLRPSTRVNATPCLPLML